MPYVNRKIRKRLDEIVEFMLLKGVDPNGELNYVLFKLCKEMDYDNYKDIKEFIAELEECAHEIRRRMLVPHEEKKMKENGDV